LLAAGLLLALVWVTDAAPAHAACATPPDVARSIEAADVVFIGRVMEVSDLNRIATMTVVEIWKGPDLISPVVVSGSISGEKAVGPSDRTYLPGETYLVVPFGRRSPFLDEACTATRLYPFANGAIPAQFQAAAGATTARMPGVAGAAAEADAGGSSATLVLGGIGGGVLLLALGIWRLKSRKKEPGRTRLATPPGPPQPAAPEHDDAPLPKPRSSRRKRLGHKQKKEKPKVSAPSKAAPIATRASEPVVKPKKERRRPSRPSFGGGRTSNARFSRSGLSNLEAMRKKTRKVKGRKVK
jgi:hypothetical protein